MYTSLHAASMIFHREFYFSVVSVASVAKWLYTRTLKKKKEKLERQRISELSFWSLAESN